MKLSFNLNFGTLNDIFNNTRIPKKRLKTGKNPASVIFIVSERLTGANIRVKKNNMPGKMASVKVKEREFALESNELFLIPLKKNCTTS